MIGRLVQQQNLGLLSQCARYRDTLPLTTRQGGHVASGKLDQTNLLDAPVHDGGISLSASVQPATVRSSSERDRFTNRKSCRDSRFLDARRDGFGDVLTRERRRVGLIDQNCATCRSQSVVAAAQRRRLATAVRSDQAQYFTGRHRESDAAQDFAVAKPRPGLDEFEQRRSFGVLRECLCSGLCHCSGLRHCSSLRYCR